MNKEYNDNCPVCGKYIEEDEQCELFRGKLVCLTCLKKAN